MVVESMMRLNIKLLIFHAHTISKALIFDQIQLELCFYYCIIKYSLVFIVYFLYYIYVIMYIFICFESSNTIYYENIKRNENTKANQHTDFRTKNTYFLIKSNIQILSFIIWKQKFFSLVVKREKKRKFRIKFHSVEAKLKFIQLILWGVSYVSRFYIRLIEEK